MDPATQTPTVCQATPQNLEPVSIAPPLPTPAERFEQGKSVRRKVPRTCHAPWRPPDDRPDPIALLEESNRSRLPNLVPIRYGRMLDSPFSFLRGAAAIMARDLVSTPATGIRAQVCGDAHLRNFGVYASPERSLLFDVNDFDETLPGPWEWDVKRLATSFVVAGRSNHFRDSDCLDIARTCVRSYREKMRTFSRMRLLEIWYSRVDAETALKVFQGGGRKDMAREMAKARHRDSLQALSKLATVIDGRLRLVEAPPLVTHHHDERLSEFLRILYRSYLGTLQDDRRHLLERYRFLDFALKVVGVGSVGTRCYIILLDSSHEDDPLLLQVKQAQESVLSAFVRTGRYHNQGHRVVTGQRLMQATSDVFLGWACVDGHDYYFRTLRDMKGSAHVENMSPEDLGDYAELCAWALARAHARSGDAATISGYMGKAETFDDAVAAFAMAYADQTERDHEALQSAVKLGRISAITGV
jgi:uncharacterized protein (DUF2252 family)